MDPVVLATVTSATTLIATEVAKGAAGEAGKALWSQIKGMFGWQNDPSPPDLAPEIARRLANDAELTKAIIELLKARREISPEASSLVQNISAEKVVVAQTLNVGGDFHMS
jgi:hypothetical protein